MRTKTIEGVTYRPYRVRYRTADKRRHQFTHWSPGAPWLLGEVGRTLLELDGMGPNAIEPKTARVIAEGEPGW